MSRHGTGWIGILMLLLGGLWLQPAAADPLAFAGGATALVAPATVSAASGTDCKQYPGLTNRVAQCIRATIDRTTKQYFKGFYKLLSRAITAFITLGVILYGVMAAAGAVERVGQDSIFLLMKIAFIGALTTNSDYMYREVIKAMDSAASAVISYTPGTGLADSANTDMSQISCIKNMRAGPWLGMDCILDTVIGIKQPSQAETSTVAGARDYYNKNFGEEQKGLSRGLLYVFFSGMQTSVIGAVFAFIGFIFLYGLVFLIIKTLFVYLAAYMGIAFLMILSPLFIPLVLLRSTKEYFDKWVKLVISLSLQPIIMLVFVSMTIAAVDLAAFSGNYSLMYRLAGDASKQKGFNINKYLEDKKAIIDKAATLVEQKANSEEIGKGKCPTGSILVSGLCESKCVQSIIDPKSPTFDRTIADQCAKSFPIERWHKSIDWKKLAEARNPPVTVSGGAKTIEDQLARECLSAAIFCGIVVFVMNGLIKIVPVVAYDLLGDFGQSPNLAQAVGGFGRKSIGAGTSQAFGGIQSAISKQLTGRGK